MISSFESISFFGEIKFGRTNLNKKNMSLIKPKGKFKVNSSISSFFWFFFSLLLKLIKLTKLI